MQIDVGYGACSTCTKTIHGVVTQGRGSPNWSNQRTTSYKVKTTIGLNASVATWTDLGTFSGNLDDTLDAKVVNYFSAGPVTARFIRFYPLAAAL